MNNQRNSWYHLGISDIAREIKRATLSYANTHRDSNLFRALFLCFLVEAQSQKLKHGFRFKNPLYSIDSTPIDLCMKLFPWADFREKKAGIKLTVRQEHLGKMPCLAVFSNAKEHDSKKIREVPYSPGDVLVFDRGYNGFRVCA